MAPSALPPPDHLRPSADAANAAAVAPGGARRKTPSELRQEQLTRAVRPRNSQDATISSPLPPPGSTGDQRKKVSSRLVDTYAVTKHHDKSKLLSSKQKDDFNKAPANGKIETAREVRKPVKQLGSIVTAKDALPGKIGNFSAADNQSGKFRDVTQLSSNATAQASWLALDMAEALKVMAPAGRRFSGITAGPGIASQLLDASSPQKNSFSDKFKWPPVDLSLKLSARFLSADSLQWCHRISSAKEVEGLKLFVEKIEWDDNMDLDSQHGVLGENGRLDRFGARFCQALHSWVHPPPQCWELYEIALTGADVDKKKNAIIARHFRLWEDAFRSLYYMFCHNHCNIFYLCTQQSVVMFERANNVEGKESESHVYWSQTTRSLRKRLQEQGVEFCMPFCTADANMSTLEDLHELSEFEKLNPGRTRLMDSRTDVDKNSESLLFFDARNVHRLFDFLLNYRFLAAYGNATDFPVLYSPVEFSKSSLYTPEVKCGRVQCPLESITKDLPARNGSIIQSNEDVSAMLYSLELKGPPGAYVTPWVVQAVCKVLQKSQKLGFEGSFVTGPLSENLNVVQDNAAAVKEVEEGKPKGLPSSRTCPTDVSMSKMRVIKHLRYCEGFYRVNMGDPS